MQRRILVVQDAADTRELINDVLSAHGAKVLAADSAKRALELIRSEVFDVLVSDIGMPEMDGCQLIAEVRKTWFFKRRIACCRADRFHQCAGPAAGIRRWLSDAYFKAIYCD